jgi:(1->4)-alpha-D-glucan 1-alpha-D-glucosylmutase
MRIPLATYRIQFRGGFGFRKAQEILDYLILLGISDIYASPIFKSKKGSTHGYDVVDSNEINPELGPVQDFDTLHSELQKRGMGWIQDIVPNHMAIDYENQMLSDVLENGPNSEYFNFFDIEWDHPYESIKGRLLAPFLGKFYGDCLESGEIQLRYDQNGFTVNYYELRFPLKVTSYGTILRHRLNSLKRKIGRDHPDFIKLLGILYSLKTIETEDEIAERCDQVRFIKRMLWEIYTTNDHMRNFLNENLEIFNGRSKDPDFNLLDSLLSEQFFRLSFWKVTTEETNYRRFFNINGLISLRVEEDAVFARTHQLILKLVEDGIFSGLRVDHIDGLYDPTEYLNRLRRKSDDLYLVVEKILDLHEDLPRIWPVQGTTGYDFINYLNGVFCKHANDREFKRLYQGFIQEKTLYKDLVYEKKKLIIDKDMSGDVDNLAHFLKRISGKDRYGNDITLNGLRRALVEVLACFPVYRTYMSEDVLEEDCWAYVEESIKKAKARRPDLLYELDFLHRFLCLEFGDHLSNEEKKNWIHWVMRFQQLSGPLMAKGFEDTTLYIYNRLLSLNEVGGNPAKFGISTKEFHKFAKRRKHDHPHSMNAGSTHDTKRGEDIRARINVLSEMPEEWDARIKIWNKLNREKKVSVNGSRAPDKNDEYFLYQTLIGSFPFYDSEMPEYVDRVKAYVVKAIREAKVHTAWLKPDTAYEEAFISFVEKLLLEPVDENPFLKSFIYFQKKVVHYGIFNSLSQTFVKIMSPGVPDFYQGSELWDLNLVDPDNRRPVDFEKRASMLQRIVQREDENVLELIDDLFTSVEDGGLKLFLIHQALKARKENAELFREGDYVPLEVEGTFNEYVLAFARTYEGRFAIAVAPRFFSTLVKNGEKPLGKEVWQDTRLVIPDNFPKSWTEVMAAGELTCEGTMEVGEILTKFPVALLVADQT